jgi:hypothetical protein
VAVRRRVRRRRRGVWTLVGLAAVLAGVLALLALAVPAWFIGSHCFSVQSRPVERSAELTRAAADVKGYFRDESSTYLTLPEWYVVYSADEYAAFVKSRAPSRFPYFSAIGQYWRYYQQACRATKRVYPFNAGKHLMLGVIGISFSAENVVKGLYENTLGVLTENLGFYHTDEDVFARKTAQEYAEFIHAMPWYEFPFAAKLKRLWTQTPLWGPDLVRKWERRLLLTAEYSGKAVYGWIIGLGIRTVHRPEDLVIHARLDDAPERVFADTRIRKVKPLGPRSYIVALPRYTAFTPVVTALARQGVRFHDLAGNDEILLTAIAPRELNLQPPGGLVLSEEILTNPATKRIGLRAPVRTLHVILTDLPARGASLEHLYDY